LGRLHFMTTPIAATVPKKIKIGIQPTGWTNDDFPEIGNDTPYQQILDETALAGFEGGSTGHNYPAHLPSLRHALATRKLGITSTWVGTSFTAPGGFERTMNYVQEQIAFLKAVGATDIVVAELAGAVNQLKDKSVLTDRPCEADGLQRSAGRSACLNRRVIVARADGAGPEVESMILRPWRRSDCRPKKKPAALRITRPSLLP